MGDVLNGQYNVGMFGARAFACRGASTELELNVAVLNIRRCRINGRESSAVSSPAAFPSSIRYPVARSARDATGGSVLLHRRRCSELPNCEVGYTYARVNRRTDARRILNAMNMRATREYIPPVVPAFIHLGLGENQKALDLLERAYERRDVLLVWLKARRHLDPLRDDPRFHDLMRRMNFPS